MLLLKACDLLGIIFLGIYIYKVVKVVTFVENDLKPIFWMLFAIFFIPFLILFFTKRILIAALRSEAPQGNRGEPGAKGNRGNEYFVETIGDKAYVSIVNEVEKMFRNVLKDNDVDFEYHEVQFKNMYLKENIKRICNSKQFIEQILNPDSETRQFDICKYDDSINNLSTRYCTDANGVFTNPRKKCNQNEDCYSLFKVEDFNDINRLLSLKNSNSPLFRLCIRVKYWIRLILENNCEDDRKLRDKLNVQKYYDLGDLRMGFVTNFQQFQENRQNGNDLNKENYFRLRKVNYKRMNNLLGRKFLHDNFQNHNYWQNNNIKNINRNPFNIIHSDPIWNWGKPIAENSSCNTSNNTESTTCNSTKEHAMG